MLRITGDINLTDGYFDTGIGTGSKIKKGMDPFQHLDITPEDYWIGNMECVCASVSNQKGLAARQFIIHPDQTSHITKLHLYTVANNHVMQHGPEAYNQMLGFLTSNNMEHAGSLQKKSHRFLHQGKRVGLMAFCQRPENFTDQPLYWLLPEYSDVKAELERLSDCDYRIVHVHWGNEFINYPSIAQKQLAHLLVDWGADLVVGMHPHVLQGYEHYKHATIFYSLGNFVFNMAWTPTRFACIVNVDLENRPVVTFNYTEIGPDHCPRIVSSVPMEFGFDHLNTLLHVNEENEKYYQRVFSANSRYQKANRLQTISNFLSMSPKDSWAILSDFLKRRL